MTCCYIGCRHCAFRRWLLGYVAFILGIGSFITWMVLLAHWHLTHK